MAKKLHTVLMPYPLQGHITPAAHLALALAGRGLTVTFVNTVSIHHQTSLALAGRGLTVTFVNTVSIHHQTSLALGQDAEYHLFGKARASGLDIRYELIADGHPLDFDRSLNHDEYMHSLLHVMVEHVEELFVRRLAGVEPPVSCLIADTFFVWPDTIAKKLGIIHVSFWTETALVFTLYYHMELLSHHGHFAGQGNRKDTITYIPGVPAIEPSNLPSYLQAIDITSVVHQIIFKAFDQAKRADFIICNTVHEFEPSVISALNSQTPKFYAIGPVSTVPTIPTSLWAESSCTQWLDRKPPSSVLYVSFGSYAHISKRELEEIAQGIMESEVYFIWAVRPDIVSSDEPDPLPTKFMEETHGRGLVVPWCRQVEVLRHEATGGFFTHCGWNSILEGIWTEVPMLCYPLLTDQMTNRKLVVEEWKVGIDAGAAGEADRRVVREGIVRLMGGGGREDLRKGIKEMRYKLESAVRPGGSSQRNLDRFINDLLGYRSSQNELKI